MDELTLEPYAARVLWRFPAEQQVERWGILAGAFLDELAHACTAQEVAVIGHIKGLVLLPGGGFLRCSKVSVQYPADVEIEEAATSGHAELEMALNVLVYGLPLSETRQIVPQVGQALARRFGAECDLLPAGSEHRSGNNGPAPGTHE